MSDINFFELEVKSGLTQKRKLKEFLKNLFLNEGFVLEEVNIVFCIDKYLLTLNKKYLNHNYFTDTLTFNLSPKGEPIVGEIYISIDRVKENATDLKSSTSTELLRVIIHSCLHLCGYKDKPKKEFLKMEHLQEHYLKSYLFHVKP